MIVRFDETTGGLISQFNLATLNPTQQSRSFSPERNDILDPTCKDCLFCQIPTMKSVPENDTAADDNRRKLENFHRENIVWLAFKTDLDKTVKNGTPHPPKPASPVTGRVMQTAPRKPPITPILEICMCRNSKCIMRGSDCGSSCFIKCIDSSGQRYPWDEEEGQCSCPACVDVNVPELLERARLQQYCLVYHKSHGW